MGVPAPRGCNSQTHSPARGHPGQQHDPECGAASTGARAQGRLPPSRPQRPLDPEPCFPLVWGGVGVSLTEKLPSVPTGQGWSHHLRNGLKARQRPCTQAACNPETREVAGGTSPLRPQGQKGSVCRRGRGGVCRCPGRERGETPATCWTTQEELKNAAGRVLQGVGRGGGLG